MPTPLPLPIRVLVKGPSTISWSSPMGDARENMALPRVIERELLLAGHPAMVKTISVPSELVYQVMRHWEREMIGYSPDVVILAFGHYESVHFLLPQWLERHANSLKQRQGRFSQLYRKRVLRPVWMSLAKLQAKLDTKLDPTLRKRIPRRVAADVESLITQIQTLHSPLVFCLEHLGPSRRFQSWFPGMAARVAVMNDAIENVVNGFDRPNIRYFRVTPSLRDAVGGDMEAATPDGFHFSTAMHEHIGQRLAAEILTWADEQAHLQLPPEPVAAPPRKVPAVKKAAAKKAARKLAAKKTAEPPAPT